MFDVVIPVNRFEHAKSRLSRVLDVAARIRLVKVMLYETLSVVTSNRFVNSIVIMTPNHETDMSEYSSQFQVEIQNDMNTSLNQNLDRICNKRKKPTLIIPVDLPLIDSDVLNEIFCRALEIEVPYVIGSPSLNNGTNALLRNPSRVIHAQFGPDSYHKHKAQCNEKRIRFIEFKDDRLALDIDTKTDLDLLLRLDRRTRTSLLVEEIMNRRT